MLLRVGSPVNQQGGPVCLSGRLESVRHFSEINVFPQDDFISLNLNFPGQTNPPEHLSHSIVHAFHRNNLLLVFQWVPYHFAEFVATLQWVFFIATGQPNRYIIYRHWNAMPPIKEPLAMENVVNSIGPLCSEGCCSLACGWLWEMNM